MFCSQCGAQLSDDIKFCSQCGTQVPGKNMETVESMPVKDPNELLLTLRPVFIPWVAVFSILPLQLFFTVCGAGFLGGFSLFLVKALKLPLPNWFTFVFFGALFFFGIPILAYISQKRTYAQTEYKFYRDRLEYSEGFWTAEQKIIKYKNITETYLRKGIIQRRYGLGTVYLGTPTTGYAQGRAMSGIRIANIENPDKVYDAVQRALAV